MVPKLLVIGVSWLVVDRSLLVFDMACVVVGLLLLPPIARRLRDSFMGAATHSFACMGVLAAVAAANQRAAAERAALEAKKAAEEKKLAEARGSFAHEMAKLARYGSYKRAKRPLTPEEAAQAADDCKTICDGLRNRAKAIW
mgnify:CR=1 FL=1